MLEKRLVEDFESCSKNMAGNFAFLEIEKGYTMDQKNGRYSLKRNFQRVEST